MYAQLKTIENFKLKNKSLKKKHITFAHFCLVESYVEDIKKSKKERIDRLKQKRAKLSEHWKMICFLTDGEFVIVTFYSFD